MSSEKKIKTQILLKIFQSFYDTIKSTVGKKKGINSQNLEISIFIFAPKEIFYRNLAQ